MGAAGAGPNAATVLRRPTAEDPPPRCATWRASGTTKRSVSWRASGATHREGGQEMSAAIDIDIGGTFTDCFVSLDDRRVWCKTRTTAFHLSGGMNEAIAEAAGRLGVGVDALLAETGIIRYSTTLAMNRLIERTGPRLGLLVTAGFEDTTLIGRGTQWADGIPVKHQRNIARISRPEPLIGKDLIVGVNERVDSTGAIVRPLHEDS